MDSLIKVENGTALLDVNVAEKIAQFEAQAKEIKKKEDELKAAILAEMEAQGIIKLDCDFLAITYVAATDRESLDTKRFRAELPDVYDEYVKLTPVKSSIRIKVK